MPAFRFLRSPLVRFSAGFCFFSAAFLSVPARAAFENLAAGARAAGMAGAYIATADDALSLYYNPAGLARVRRPELTATYSRLFWGLDDNSDMGRGFLGYAHPLGDRGVLGLGYVRQGLSSLYVENTYGLSYGRAWEDWNFGGTVKMLGRTFGTDAYSSSAVDPTGAPVGAADPVASGGKSKSAVALDLGAQYAVTSHYMLAAAWRNINQPDVGVSGGDKVPMDFALAVQRLTRIAAVSFQVTESRFAGRWNHAFALGGERWYFNGFGLRAGLGTGTRSAHRLSLGAGFRREPVQVDYAFDYPLGDLDTFGSHLISVTVRFGPPPRDPLEQRVEDERRARLKAEAELADLKKKIQALLDKTGLPAPAKPILPPLPQKTEESGAAGEAAQPARPAKPARPSVSSKDLMDYTEALKFYAYQVKSGAAVDQRVATLQSIIERFQNKNIDLSAVRRELSRLQDENKKVAEDYKLAVAYYQKIVQTGTTADERTILLDRIIKKYKPFGLDTSALEQELNSIRK